MRLHSEFFSINSHLDIESRWCQLEKHRKSFFLSRYWIFNWIKYAAEAGEKYAFLVYDDKIPVAIALFNDETICRRLIFRTRLLSLNDSAIERYNFSIEYNGMLTAPGYESSVVQQLLEFVSRNKQYDELKLNAIDQSWFDLIQKYIGGYKSLKLIVNETSACWLINLKKFNQFEEYSRQLSKKRRYQIRKSIQYYEKYGAIEATIAKNSEQALEYFDELGVLHEDKWKRLGKHGAFHNNVWVDFHKSVIASSFDQDHIILYKLSANGKTIGILYILVDNGYASVIQTGFAYDEDKYAQPGFLTHYNFIDYAITNNLRVYDFLAGDSPYKAILATEKQELHWVSVQNISLKSQIENSLLAIKRKLL